MARLLSEGWEVQSLVQCTANASTAGWVWAAGRTGGRGSYSLQGLHGIYYSDLGYFQVNLGANKEELYIRFYVRFSSLCGLNGPLFRLLDSAGTAILQLYVNEVATPELHPYRTTSDQGAVQPTGWTPVTWTLIEVYAKAVSGETIFTVKLDGAQIYTDTWAETTGAGNLRTVDFRRTAISSSDYWDDIVINDALGAACNSWPGGGSFVALLPTSTSSAGLQGSDGNQTDNHLLVDERAADADTTYVYSTAAAEDRYGLEDISPALASGEVIVGVQPVFRVRKDGASTLGARLGLRSGTTDDYDSTLSSLTSTYLTSFGTFRTADPDTGAAWSESGVNALGLIVGVV